MVHEGVDLGHFEVERLGKLQLVTHTQIARGSGVGGRKHVGGQIYGGHLGSQLRGTQGSLEAGSAHAHDENLGLKHLGSRFGEGDGDGRGGNGTSRGTSNKSPA